MDRPQRGAEIGQETVNPGETILAVLADPEVLLDGSGFGLRFMA